MVTTGSQQAFDLLVRVLVDPGDNVYVESPAYPAALQALRLAKAKISEVAVDADGLDTNALRQRLTQAAPGARPKLLYTVPTFSNPSGHLLSRERRRDLVALALEFGFLIVEDDPYGELSFGERLPTVYAIGKEMSGADNPVIYLSSLSKTVAPALRIGWMLAAPEVLGRCVIAKQVVDLCTSPLAQGVAAEYLASDRYKSTVERATGEYSRRMDAMTGGLRKELGDKVQFATPRGGMFLWAELCGPVDMRALFEASVNAGVIYVPGSAFYLDRPDSTCLRLSYAAPTVEDIGEGVFRLRRALSAVIG